MISEYHTIMNTYPTTQPSKKLSIVQSRGQITLPTELRNKYNITKGAVVGFKETEQGILITPQQVIASNLMDKIGQILTQEGISLEELVENTPTTRSTLAK
jgi:bifunctional DNA-binding transcriptional regulator/antitoxin component of YhaV-PrlF toxin-antitoxin module